MKAQRTMLTPHYWGWKGGFWKDLSNALRVVVNAAVQTTGTGGHEVSTMLGAPARDPAIRSLQALCQRPLIPATQGRKIHDVTCS